jgi:hypothetical protein
MHCTEIVVMEPWPFHPADRARVLNFTGNSRAASVGFHGMFPLLTESSPW